MAEFRMTIQLSCFHSMALNYIEIRNQTAGSLSGSYLTSPLKYDTRKDIYYPVVSFRGQTSQGTLSRSSYQGSGMSQRFKRRGYKYGTALTNGGRTATLFSYSGQQTRRDCPS